MSTPVTYLRRKCVILPLVLKGKWYDMIAAGEKREEYRDATAYWAKRLWNWNTAFTEATIPVVEFRRGYASDAPRMAYWTMGLPCASGILPFAFAENRCLHPEWGEPTTAHFLIRLGGPITLQTRETQGGTSTVSGGVAVSILRGLFMTPTINSIEANVRPIAGTVPAKPASRPYKEIL